MYTLYYTVTRTTKWGRVDANVISASSHSFKSAATLMLESDGGGHDVGEPMLMLDEVSDGGM